MEKVWVPLVIGLAAFVFSAFCFAQWWHLHKQKWNSNFSDAELKPLWGNGTKLFAEEWVLKLRVRIPKIDMKRDVPLPEFFQELSRCHSIAMGAMNYFSDGTYFVKRDGSLIKIGDGGFRATHYIEVNATIDFDDLTHDDVLAHRLRAKPETAMERTKNCVLLDVHAHGTGKRTGKAEFDCMPRFAARDGKVIVESY